MYAAGLTPAPRPEHIGQILPQGGEIHRAGFAPCDQHQLAPPAAARSARTRRAASRSRRLARLRMTALPSFFVAVKPRTGAAGVAPCSACSTKPGLTILRPCAARRRKSARCLKRLGRDCLGMARMTLRSGRVKIRRRAWRGPWPGGWPEPCGRQRSPCGRGNHAGACGRVWKVDKSVSRYSLRQKKKNKDK